MTTRGETSMGKRRWLPAIAVAAGLAGLVAAVGAWGWREMKSVSLTRAEALSVVMLDREDRL